MTATVTPIRKPFQVNRFDAVKHGVLSRNVVLPWENRDDFLDIPRGLLDERQPPGPTAYHLVEDLACAIWRKRRLIHAETSAITANFHQTTRGYAADRLGAKALTWTRDDLATELVDAVTEPRPAEKRARRAKIDQALTRLAERPPEAVIATLDDATAAAWSRAQCRDETAEELGFPADPDLRQRLADCLEQEREALDAELKEAPNVAKTAAHAQGRALDAAKLTDLAQLEAALDQKILKLLAALERCAKAATNRSRRLGLCVGVCGRPPEAVDIFAVRVPYGFLHKHLSL